MSELIREALRHYERRSWWDDVNAYGRSRAERQGIREQDVDRIIPRSARHPPRREKMNFRPNQKDLSSPRKIFLSPTPPTAYRGHPHPPRRNGC